MDALVNALRTAIADLAKSKGIEGARVLDKTNARGEIVIALVLPVDNSAPDTAPKPRVKRVER